ncbi:MAG: hypothetical protein DRJ31_09645 [Candidatus Methanomethylicota archaeon]|uniref:HTH arsR-type domain-containing protein n=1 Tax=Thermoproteota archaeon TaxID=2056631 RepID=A0A497EMF6_9CREN|nr:MAG: hypothetical protein DRJ31_09645 [Candidatus Verstraetearchaeota archaeon]
MQAKISDSELKKLSSTKIRILKSLENRRKTLSEMSRELEISKSALHQHLNKLCEFEFVRRVEDGHKWVYYELTDKARVFLKRHIQKVALIISSLIASVFASLYMLARYFTLTSREWVAYKEVPRPTPVPSYKIAAGPGYAELITLTLALVFAAISVVLLLLYLKLRVGDED